MSDLDDLTTALIAGDPNETVDLPTVRAMAEAALSAGWQPKFPLPVLSVSYDDTKGVMTVMWAVCDHRWSLRTFTHPCEICPPAPEGPDDALDQ